MARSRLTIACVSIALALVASGAAILLTSVGPASAFTPGEGTGKMWCPGYGGKNLGSYRDVYACLADSKNAGKTPFDSYGGFQCTELANRFLFATSGRTLFDNDVGGNFVALAAASFSIPDAASGTPGSLPAAGDIISMWGGRSKQQQNGDRTLVAVITKVAVTSAGWTISTLNQGDQSDTDGADGFNTITVSSDGKSWSTEDGFYTSFEWLELTRGAAGISWTSAQAPRTGSGVTGQLVSVACSSPTSCAAVGSSGDSATLIARSGGAWASAAVPLPASSVSSAQLAAVSCPSGTACVAVGSYRASGRQQGLVLSGAGTSWTATRAPLPGTAAASPDVSLLAVTCQTAASCVAVGQYTASSGSSYGLILTGDGSSWTGSAAPLPSDARKRPAARLTSVVCPSADECTAVGSYTDQYGNEQGMVVTGSGRSWTAVRAALPASAVVPGASLSAVACPEPASCVAVGTYSGNTRGMVLVGSGTSWSASSAPLPAGAAANPAATLQNVTCTSASGSASGSASACVAVGSYTDSKGNTDGLLLAGHGAAWTAVRAPLPSGAAGKQGSPGAELASVACPSAGKCVAVGEYTDTVGDADVLLLAGHGSSWKAARAPVPANGMTVGTQAQGPVAPPFLASITCPSASACVAVGAYPSRGLGMQGLLVTGPA
jgi:hypothetical protein